MASRRHKSVICHKNIYTKVCGEVREAVMNQKPVIALETAIYTHGFPYPDNIALATHLESIVRKNGAIPATIGVLNGIARVGFSAEELDEFTASAGRPETRKLSRRDLAYALGLGRAGRKLNGGTTISGTMVLAELAGIEVLATGGLGGVHRGGESSMDISADLTELGRTPMAVIAGGCKSFLDIPRTLEYLETEGVTVGTFADGRKGQVDFPAFWTRDSGHKSPLTIRDEEEAAHIILQRTECKLSEARRGIPIRSGVFFGSPIPAENSIAKNEMDRIVSQAVCDAERSRSTGSDNTPFILNRIHEITAGASVTANRALVESNVARGTKVAVQLAKINESSRIRNWTHEYPLSGVSNPYWAVFDNPMNSHRPGVELLPTQNRPPSDVIVDVIVAGSLALDFSCDFTPPRDMLASKQPQFHTSNPASITQSLGGVGQNIATALHYLDSIVRLCSSVADDVAGSNALQMLSGRALQISGIHRTTRESHTAQYVAVNDARKDLIVAMADMNILEDPNADFDALWKPHLDACKPKWLVTDANWDPYILRKWLTAAKLSGSKVAYEPVSAAKSRRIFDQSHPSLSPIPDHSVDLATPNALELASMHEAAYDAGVFEREDWWRLINTIGLSNSGSRDKLVSLTNSTLVDQGVPQQTIKLLPFIPCILTTLGEHGVLMTQILRPGDDRLTFPDSAPYIISRSTDGNAVVGGVYMRHFMPVEKVASSEIVSVNGVGDTFLGILIAGLTRDRHKDIADLVDIAQRGSVMTLKSREAVNPEIAKLGSLL